ncbi:energy transducer TonB [Qipengyuania sp. DGS5-3]|uniref:energy transducer TonB n=1 Tax=Qipengyuania sp. DGS5-3 TaxID=3349632 RepID=UPI0036D263B9
MRGFSYLGAALALTATSFTPISASAAEPVVLQPSSPWHLDYAEKKCRLSRVFGGDGNKHVLFFEQGAPGSSRMLVLGGSEVRRFRGSKRVKLQFGFDGPQQDEQPYAGDLDDLGPALIYPGVSLVEIDDDATKDPEEAMRVYRTLTDPSVGAGAEFVRLKLGKRVLDFAADDLAKPLAALTHCSFDLLSDWGLSPDAHRSATRLPFWLNEAAIARRIQATYPSDALRKGEQGIIRLRVIVDEDGTVAECELENATTVDELESPACEAMRNAKFEPALDKNSQPMRSYYATQIIYSIG